MLLLSIFVWATAAASLDTAASISAAVESFRCDLVKSIIARQPSADASSASAFCSTFIRAEQKTFTAATVTSTVRGRCFATQPAQSVSLTKRELENRAVRSPGVLCPKYMTALGTNALSRACSCLTAAPITTTPTAFLTVFTPVTTTTTSTVTVTPTASTIYLASISSKLLTSTATIISLTTSQAVSTGTAYSTATVSDISTVISLRPVTTVTVVSTITILSTQTILSTTTSTTTATSLVKRLAPPSSPASSLPAAAPTGCYTVTSTAFATITIARPTLTIALPSIALSTFAQTDTSTSTVTTTRITRVTIQTVQTVSSTTTSISDYTAFGSSTTTTTSVTTTTSATVALATYIQKPINLVRNPSFEDSDGDRHPVDWRIGKSDSVRVGGGSETSQSGSVYALMYTYVTDHVSWLQQDISDASLVNGYRCSFYYKLYPSGGSGLCSITASWAGNEIFSRAFTLSETVNYWFYSGILTGGPSAVTSGSLNFTFACVQGQYPSYFLAIDTVGFGPPV